MPHREDQKPGAIRMRNRFLPYTLPAKGLLRAKNRGWGARRHRAAIPPGPPMRALSILNRMVVRVGMKLVIPLGDEEIEGDGVIEGDIHFSIAHNHGDVVFLGGNP